MKLITKELWHAKCKVEKKIQKLLDEFLEVRGFHVIKINSFNICGRRFVDAVLKKEK